MSGILAGIALAYPSVTANNQRSEWAEIPRHRNSVDKGSRLRLNN